MDRSLMRMRAALAGLALVGVLAGVSLAATGGADALPDARALPAARPERALLMGIARAGSRLVAVGEHGVVVLSDDNGIGWRNAAQVPVDATLTAVRFADEKRGWAIGHLGVVLRTDDGGEHWVKQLDGTTIGRLAQAAADLPADDAKRLAEEGPDKSLLDLLVQDGQRVTVVGAYNLALATSDGGRSWRVASQRFDNPERLHLYGIALASTGVVAVGEQGLVLRQQGDAVRAAKRPYDGSFFGLAVVDGTVLAFGLRGNAFASHDGGATWRPSKLPGSGASINASLRLSDGRLLLADQAGGVFISEDDGEQFQRVPFAWGAPITGLAEAADGAVIVASLGGVTRMPRPGAAPVAHAASSSALGGAK